jgi:prevent-host-death family protein
MRVMRALEVRAKFGEVIDAAAAGERIVVERAGHPVAAIVPLSDLDAHDPEKIKQRRLEAIHRIRRLAKRLPPSERPFDATAWIRADRDSGHHL